MNQHLFFPPRLHDVVQEKLYFRWISIVVFWVVTHCWLLRRTQSTCTSPCKPKMSVIHWVSVELLLVFTFQLFLRRQIDQYINLIRQEDLLLILLEQRIDICHSRHLKWSDNMFTNGLVLRNEKESLCFFLRINASMYLKTLFFFAIPYLSISIMTRGLQLFVLLRCFIFSSLH